MDEQPQRTALLSALTTKHFVLQTANSSTYSEASARSTLYVMALSSSLVAMGFLSGSADVLIPFAAIVLPAVFLLGIFTVARLVETTLESMHKTSLRARVSHCWRAHSSRLCRVGCMLPSAAAVRWCSACCSISTSVGVSTSSRHGRACAREASAPDAPGGRTGPACTLNRQQRLSRTIPDRARSSRATESTPHQALGHPSRSCPQRPRVDARPASYSARVRPADS